MKNSINEISFKSKECKNKNHSSCSHQWKGFGFQIICICKCHKKLVLGRDESLPNTIINQTPERRSYHVYYY